MQVKWINIVFNNCLPVKYGFDTIIVSIPDNAICE